MLIAVTVLGLLTLASAIAGAVALGRWAAVAVKDVLAQRTRKLDLDERELAVREARARTIAPPKAIPPDLFRRIARWGDMIAQESERKAILDLYAEFADDPDPWGRVRQHLPAEPSDEISPELFRE